MAAKKYLEEQWKLRLTGIKDLITLRSRPRRTTIYRLLISDTIVTEMAIVENDYDRTFPKGTVTLKEQLVKIKQK